MQDNPKVKGNLASLTESNYVFTCPIVKGEILFGIVRLPAGKRRRELEQKADELFAKIPCDPIPENVGNVYAQIKAAAQQRGTPLGECDLWIAATALVLDAILVTSDSDYQRIVGVSIDISSLRD